ncbi:exonuclease subunit SbcD [Rudanella paleaurantiibacter]|uniref:Nuclease SbcCD subunit D n=1 Tax=Rudanella paleaurantiibacter TaxID=2614655 RepID=A0A7J5TRV5_9BACT|nr:exonuclease subunit SbcD [Rudanella paleaurantiibacter]KAB7725389.1 exonuclease subunit SbcD [Rudanella paleaurantiibacter]
MKILHTGDWHLGKRLYKHDLRDDHELFLNWLADLVDERDIDVLLIAGDIFDTTNPNDGSMSLYYKFLTRMLPLGRRIIITGGNHDSATKLNAPRELLRHLDIHVVGCTSHDCADEVIRINQGSTDLVVAAVPYLRDADLRQSISGQSYEERVEALRTGIRNHYERLADYCHQSYAGVPVMAMGHLYVNGASVSESEREIHCVGGQAAFSTEHFPGGFNYVALGHIHMPQSMGTDGMVRYSGSPIPLSFSERANAHQVLELSLENGVLTNVCSVRVPSFRRLQHVVGTLEQVRDSLEQITAEEGQLTTLVEILVEEAQESHATRLHFEQLHRDYIEAPFSIAKARLVFQSKREGLESLLVADTYLQDLSYLDVFERRLDSSLVDPESRPVLLETYKQLYRAVTEQASPFLHENSADTLS